MKVKFDGRIPWLQGRQKYIGSSDAPAILGYGYSNQSPITVWNSKVNDVQPEFDDQTLALMKNGQMCEPYVVDRFSKEHPELVVEGQAANETNEMVVCKEHPYLSSTLDAIARSGDEIIPVEAKWILYQSQEWADGECPMKYQIQLMHQMICTGAKRGCVAAFVRGEYMERWFEWDDEVVEYMIGEYQKFWSHVIDRTPPPDDSSNGFRILRPEPELNVAKMAGGELSSAIRNYNELQDKAKLATQDADRAKNRIASELSECGYVILDDQTVFKLTKNCVKQVKKLPRGVQLI